MSRTFRHRHLPVVVGGALKFVDSGTQVSSRILEARLESYYAHTLHKAPCIVGGPSVANPGWKKSHNRCIYAAHLPILGWREEKALLRDLGWHYAVARVGSHPWVPWWAGSNGAKTYSRIHGHRRCRRKTVAILYRLAQTAFDWDGSEENWPLVREEIDPWDWD